jgi:cardiolipin synthase
MDRTCRPGRLFSILLTVFLLSGCASLPNVSEIIRDAAYQRTIPKIASPKGTLSPQQSVELLNRLKQSSEPTDMVRRHLTVIESVSGAAPVKGNRVKLLVDGPATYAAMFKAVESANDHINFETFIFESDETGRKFADLLIKKQSEGVQVNLMYDSVGSLYTPAEFFQRMRDAGIQVLSFNPLTKWRLTHRDHRKILVVDGKTAITGGVNISGVYSSGLSSETKGIPWRDTDVQIDGPAVAEFQKLFIDSWQKQKGPDLGKRNYFPKLKEQGSALVQVIGSTPGEMNRMTFVLYVSALTFAESRIHMTNAYFVPDEQILSAIEDAAKRGVDVKMILAETSDVGMAIYAGQYNYADLLKSGVKLYERKNAILHAKTAVIDGAWATVGSTNMDYWSFLRNDEVNTVILSATFAEDMERMFAADLAQSKEITLEEWSRRPLYPRIREWIAHLFMQWL